MTVELDDELVEALPAMLDALMRPHQSRLGRLSAGVEAAEGVGSEEPEPAAEEGVAARAPEAVARMVSVGELFAVGEDVKVAEALPPPPPLLAVNAGEGDACEAVAVEDGVGG